ncbi:MAG: glycoside hydrolase family 2 TIM barrel-domain containing protein [Eubacteriales bacterium]|nr:glycoside hydrolase family 2 TIM barrel-domain containing protein [Eubacteriales bacterium]
MKKQKFNLGWLFVHGKEDAAPEEMMKLPEEAFCPVKLPHDWSLDFPFEETAATCGSGGYVTAGIGWYRKSFRADAGKNGQERLFLQFDGVYMLAQVWINGVYLGRHVYGYTPFSWDITELVRAGEENTVLVKVDNSAQPSSRWYSGSGITRDVWMCTAGAAYIPFGGVWLRQDQVDEERALLTVQTRVATGKGQADCPSVFWVETQVWTPDNILCFKESAQRQELLLPRDGTELVFDQKITLEKPVLWDTEHPSLYRVITRVYQDGRLQDQEETLTGLRSAVFCPEQGFLLNGVRTKLNGVCIHHDGGCVGAAVPPAVWERRLEKLREMGVNAVRMSHNPPDPALLDLCDRMGFLVMDEAFDEWRILKGKELGSNTHESRGYSEWFDQCHEEDLRGMLLRDRNHPCVVIWSIGNEVPDQTDPMGCQTARRLKAICRELDGTRAVTQANDQICAEPRAARAEFLEVLDVVGYNYVNRWRTRAETMYDDDRRAHPDWCMIGTENSSLGGRRGVYQMEMTEHAGWWKHPYYSAPVQVGRLLRFTMTHDYVAGDFMWTGVDYLGEANWPDRSSSAGVLDTCGFEKDSFYFYQSIWRRDKPMAHLLPHWNLEEKKGSIVRVLGYTSCETAELFLNGKSYGKKAYSYPDYGMTERYGHFDKYPVPASTDDLFLSWDVPYEPGCIELVGYQDGQEAARHTVHTAGKPAAVRLTCRRSRMRADGLDVAQLEAELVDENGNFCPTAENELHFGVEGPGEIIGVDNGNPSGHESLRADHIHAFSGKAFAVLRSTGAEGTCNVSVYAKGLAQGCTIVYAEK